MLVARGRIENKQAIVKIGFRPFVPETYEVRPTSSSFAMPVEEYRALLDTGAQRTCLSRHVIVQEKLRHHAKRPIQNVHEVKRHYLYWVHIGFLCERVANLAEPEGEQTYYAFEHPHEVIDIADNRNFDAIIGMDILAHTDLLIERDGTFCLTVSRS